MVLRNFKKQPDLRIEMWPIERLIPYARNPRKNDAHVDRMAESIKEFGFRIPVVAKSDGAVVDGHLRLKAAQKLRLTQIPVVLADELSEAQIKSFRLLANKSVAWSDWDIKELALEFDSIRGLGVDLASTGFNAYEISEIENAARIGLDGKPSPSIDESRFGKGGARIKVVLTAEYLELFEKALDATAQMNRAEALKLICEEYLGTKR